MNSLIWVTTVTCWAGFDIPFVEVVWCPCVESMDSVECGPLFLGDVDTWRIFCWITDQFFVTSTTEGEGGYVFIPFCLFVNWRNPSDFGNYVGQLCVSFCVCLSVCLFVCVFVYPVAATPFQRSWPNWVQTSAMVQLRHLSFFVNLGQRSRSKSPKNQNSYFRNNVR